MIKQRLLLLLPPTWSVFDPNFFNDKALRHENWIFEDFDTFKRELAVACGQKS
jgi:hypothetical protein